MISNKRDKRLLNNVKLNAVKLKENGQIPLPLYDEILYLNFNSDMEDVKFLMELSKHFLRIRGYYFQYSDLNEECKKAIEKYKSEKRS